MAENQNIFGLNVPDDTAQSQATIPLQTAFTSQYPTNLTGTVELVGLRPIYDAEKTQLEYYEPDAVEDRSSWLATTMSLLNDANQTDYQTAATYLSIVSYYMIGMEESVRKFFDNRGFSKAIVKLPSQAHEFSINLVDGKIEFLDQLVLLGQLILCIFKNFTENNFSDYMRKRIKAISARVSTADRTEVLVYFSYTIATRIRRIVGGDVGIRRRVLDHLLDGRSGDGPYAALCGYLTQILEYNEMGSFLFVNETLVLTKSPVLAHRSVTSEVKNFYNAVKVIKNRPHPQFFRIRASGDEYHLLDRSKFPTLIDVAVAIRSETHPTMKRYATPEAINREAIIAELTDLHKNTTMRVSHPSHAQVVKMLTDED